ncbi:MAG: hypothetical protein FJ104_00100 [Deltaproteobacteria bacterium]|nr:hypothetical protein [Deltaproteobacteria bacterium]
MTTAQPSLRVLYQDYLAGRATFDDVKRATDEAVVAFETSRGRKPTPDIETKSTDR